MALRIIRPLCLAGLAAALGACGSSVSTSRFKGEEHRVAQAIANLQSDATGGEQDKICANDLAASVVRRLGGEKRCRRAIKDQLNEIDSLDVTVESVKLAAGGKGASAQVKSTYGGKKRLRTVSLVREGSDWKVLSVQ